jgi:hypothetical protein
MNTAIPDSRTYIHEKCGQATDVSESEFKIVASPLPGCRMTMCCACAQHFPIAEFKWADSGERIVDYYNRHRAKASLSARLVSSLAFTLALVALGGIGGVAAGVAAGNWVGIIVGFLVGIVSVLVGMVAGLLVASAIETRVVARSLGVPDVRCLK